MRAMRLSPLCLTLSLALVACGPTQRGDELELTYYYLEH